VLPAPARLRRGQDIREVVRSGRRGATRTLVVHFCPAETSETSETSAAGTSETSGMATPAPARSAPICPQVGLLVSKAVGGSVVRHRVARQLRHLCADRLGSLPSGSRMVVRALPPAAGERSAVLGEDLDRALARVGR
jgi:ribonuclease P protein component